MLVLLAAVMSQVSEKGRLEHDFQTVGKERSFLITVRSALDGFASKQN